MMHLKSSGITGKFARFMELPEALIRSFFSTLVAGFEAYGAALCGHVPSACPTEPEDRSTPAKVEGAVIREPQTMMFVVVRNRSDHKISTLPEGQF